MRHAAVRLLAVFLGRSVRNLCPMNIPGYVWIVVATGLIGSVGCATSHRAEAPVGGTAFVRHDTSGSGNSGVRYYLAPSPQGPRPLLVLRIYLFHSMWYLYRLRRRTYLAF